MSGPGVKLTRKWTKNEQKNRAAQRDTRQRERESSILVFENKEYTLNFQALVFPSSKRHRSLMDACLKLESDCGGSNPTSPVHVLAS